MAETLLVKLGGSLITEKTDDRGAVRRDVLARLAAEIARARQAITPRLVLGHGSGSFGHVAAREHGIAEGLRSPAQLPGISKTQERAAALHREVLSALAAARLAPYSIAPSSCMVFAGGRAAELFDEPLRLALDAGLLPVVYGDVVMDREQGVAICSTERILETLATRLTVRQVLWLGETDGVYGEDGRILPRISSLEGLRFTSPAGTDVTGGMRHRVETALALARHGVKSVIFNGLTPGLLERALLGETVPGTEVV
ncbi:MAG TPA: isopentenyl phosphate kinase [Thermoanaerobaculia bacterium]|jgi:isopentenyl phosphate kinase|nr:isopentenyl phosphate kinase [Thermoanaerobaculia bacterium]